MTNSEGALSKSTVLKLLLKGICNLTPQHISKQFYMITKLKMIHYNEYDTVLVSRVIR